MKCRFCGKRIKKNSNVCSKCGKEVTEGIATDELIDALPELHDEFDNISKMQQKERRILDTGPATAVIAIPFLYFLKLRGLTFTGFAHPNPVKSIQRKPRISR